MRKFLPVILTILMLFTVISVFAENLPSGAASISVIGNDGGYLTKISGEKTGILRFLSKIEYEDGYEIEEYGMKFAPFTLGEGALNWAEVSSREVDAYKSGDTFTADLENISESFIETKFLGVAYAKFKGYDNYIFSPIGEFSQSKVNLEKNLGTKQTLQCNMNGDFKILLVADVHGSWDASKENLEILIEKEDPDFVVIHGDTYVSGHGTLNQEKFADFISPLENEGIPWTITNGNHDPYTSENWTFFKSFESFVGETVSESDANYDESRPVNSVLPIYANDGKTPVFNVWTMDTGTSNSYGYEGVTQKQVDWYKVKSAQLKEEQGGDLTGLMLLHIPPTEMIDLYYSKTDGGTNTVGTAGDAYQPIYGKVYGTFSGVTDYTTSTGTLVDNTAMNATHPQNNRGIFNAMKEMGNIDISISGHDHANNFIGVYGGIMMGFTGRLVGETYSRGARVIKFNQSNPESFTTKWITLYESGEDQPEINKDGTVVE